MARGARLEAAVGCDDDMKSTCRSCGAEIMWIKTKADKNMPVNMTPTNLERRAPKYTETVFDPERHESHFATCPKADQHRRSR